MPRILRSAARRFALVAAVVLLAGAGAAPAALAQATEPQPDLDVSVAIDNRDHLVGEAVAFTVTITNNGDGVATGVTGWVSSPAGFFVQSHLWGEFSPFGPGGTVNPGESRVLQLYGDLQAQEGGGAVAATVTVNTVGDANPFDNQEPFTVSFVPTSILGDLGGVVFGDQNANGTVDRGEGLAGVRVDLYGFGAVFTTTTGADGVFGFADLPSRMYSPSYSQLPDGWIVPFDQQRQVGVNGTVPPSDLLVQAVRPLTDTLRASLEFVQDDYLPGDLARMTLTVENTGRTAIAGIVAGCNRSGEGPHITPGPEWDQLSWPGPGVTVEAGQTRQFELTGTVPASATDYGHVSVACDFGNDDDLSHGFPFAADVARVPGQPGDAPILFYEDRDGDLVVDDGEGIEHLKIGLVDAVDGRVVTKLRTDAAGRVHFTGLPAGLYQVRIYGPWNPALADSTFVVVGTCWICGAETAIDVERG